MNLAIGIDLGGTNTKSAVVDSTYRVLAHRSIPTLAERGPQVVVAALAQSVAALIQEADADRGDLVGVGLATPGPLDLRSGRITKAANLPGWRDVPIRELLGKQIGLPVTLENDGNAAAYGEYVAGAGVGCGHLVVLTLGTGVGAGVIVNGTVLHGHFDNAGELGHLIVVVDGAPCPCGQRGCLERYASADAIVRRAQEATDGSSPLTAEDVVRAAAGGDTTCARVWDEACKYLAVACVNVQHAFNPRRILLAGGLSRAGGVLLDRVREHLRTQAWSLHCDIPEVALAALGSDAGVIGAAALAFGAQLE